MEVQRDDVKGSGLFVFLLEFGFTHNYISQLRHDVNIITIARHHKKSECN